MTSEGADLVITFPRRAGVAAGLETVEESSALDAGWAPVPAASVTHSGTGGQTGMVTVRLPAAASRRFVRVKTAF